MEISFLNFCEYIIYNLFTCIMYMWEHLGKIPYWQFIDHCFYIIVCSRFCIIIVYLSKSFMYTTVFFSSWPFLTKHLCFYGTLFAPIFYQQWSDLGQIFIIFGIFFKELMIELHLLISLLIVLFETNLVIINISTKA